MHRTLLAMLLLFPALATAAVTVRAPASVGVGQPVSIAISGSTNRKDFVSILPKGAAAGAWSTYAYVDGPGPFTLAAPTAPGEYEVRVLGAVAPHPTLARAPLRVEAVTVTLDAPAQVPAGKPFKVRWKGPNNERDYVAIGNASQPYINYAYTSAGAELTITAPDAPGDYEIRYLLGQDDSIIGRRRIVVGGVSASVAGPGRVAAGASFAVT
jgi:Ca-activated chloride channel family protein